METSPTSRTSVYMPLSAERKEIRLLLLEHAIETDEPLCFRMVITSLLEAAAESYHAVSYTWGNNSRRTPIRINGMETDVPTSGADALRGILNVFCSRKERGPTLLWIDAICIDQKSHEKSWHVARMKDVYAQASSVLVWLGPSINCTAESVVRSLNVLSEDSLRWTDGLGGIQQDNDLTMAEKESLPYWSIGPPDADWNALILLLHNRWFTRLWVVQELALGRQVLCILGEYSFEWEDLARAFMWATHRDFLLDHKRYGDEAAPYDTTECSLRLNMLQSFALIRRYLHTEVATADQTHFVCLASQLETTVPHDRVYALLGILSHPDWGRYGELAVRSRADYDRPLVDVYADITWASIHTKGDLRALEMAMYLLPPPDIQNVDWPSWVPRYYLGKTGQTSYTTPIYQPRPPIYGASAGTDETCIAELYQHHDPSAILRLQGLCVAQVERVFASPVVAIASYRDLSADEQEEELLKHFTYLWDAEFLGNANRRWSKALFKTIAATLVAHSVGEENLEVDFADFVLQVQHECEGPISDDLNQLLLEYDYSEEFQYGFLLKLEHACNLYPSSTTFVQLSEGRFALCPNAVAEGDEVCILFGADYPWVLRKQGNVWRMLGTCVVPEIMQVRVRIGAVTTRC